MGIKIYNSNDVSPFAVAFVSAIFLSVAGAATEYFSRKNIQSDPSVSATNVKEGQILKKLSM